LQTENPEPIFLGMHDEGDLHSLPGEWDSININIPLKMLTRFLSST
jgi:hypothetical protein